MNALQHLKNSEGCKLEAYQDSLGVWTIGYGKNLQVLQISQLMADQWLAQDYAVATANTAMILSKERVSSSAIGQARFEVLTEMCYNLGPTGLQRFKKMFSALRASAYRAASEEMLDSLWASQVHSRAVRLAAVMAAGSWAVLDPS